MTSSSPRSPAMFRQFALADWFTLANAACGAGAIFSLMTYLQVREVAHIYYAGGLVAAALVFDFLDGRIARWRRRASAMGLELDFFLLVALAMTAFVAALAPAGAVAGRPCQYRRIAAGGDGARPFSCGIEVASDVYCWGNNQFGQIDTPDGEFVEVGAGAYHACAIRADDSIECWGNDDALHDTDPPDGGFQSLAIGWFGPNCALRNNGAVACWGFGELALGVPAGSFEAVAASGEVACALDDAGIPTCWRYVEGGSQDDIVFELLDVPGGAFAGIAVYFDAGASFQHTHVCGRRSNGQVTCWTDEEDDEPWTAPSGTFGALAPSGAAACGIRTDGTIACWGPDWVEDFLDVPEGEFVSVASGGGQVCGLAGDGSVVCTQSEEPVSLCAPSPLCGNGEIDDLENCDDGDTSFVPGDGCTDGCSLVPCGQPLHPEAEAPVASDALFALRAAVGTNSCSTSVCDADGNSLVTAADALAILRKSVDPGRVLGCEQASASMPRDR